MTRIGERSPPWQRTDSMNVAATNVLGRWGLDVSFSGRESDSFGGGERRPTL